MRQTSNNAEYDFVRESLKYVSSIKRKYLRAALTLAKLGVTNSANMLERAVADLTDGTVVNLNEYDVLSPSGNYECKSLSPRWHSKDNKEYGVYVNFRGKTGDFIIQIKIDKKTFKYYKIPYSIYHKQSTCDIPCNRPSPKWDQYFMGYKLSDCF